MKLYSVYDIRAEFVRQWEWAMKSYGSQDRHDIEGEQPLEIINAVFTADEPYIFCKPNEDYIQRELDWYMSQSLNVYDIPGKIPAIWKDVADRDGFINSNYGWCIYSEENCNQYRNCLKQLLEDKDTRRACMIYNRPSMQYDYHSNGMSDFMCTFATQQFIRQGQLVYLVYMRSNDAVFGYRNDYAFHRTVADKLNEDLKANGYELTDTPKIIWNAGSLHVYPRHWKFIEQYYDSQLHENIKTL